MPYLFLPAASKGHGADPRRAGQGRSSPRRTWDRVFDVFLQGNISNMGYSFTRLGKAALDVALSRKDQYRLCSVRGMIRLLVFTVLLCPLFALYMFGLFVSPWISLWRLWRTIGQDYYRMASGEKVKLKSGEMANLKPALLVLYSLALLQGVLFYYWAVSASEEKRLVKRVAEAYEIDEGDKERMESVSNYLRQIRAACEKDPSFARGRNLITYTVDLMESNSPANYYHGTRILDTLIRQFSPMDERQHERIRRITASAPRSDNNAETRFSLTVVKLPASVVESQRTLITNMIGSSSSSDTIKKLVRMLDTKNPDDQETWFCAMRIVAYFAKEIRLDKIMYGIRSISSLLEYKGETRKYEVFCAGMKILSGLAEDKENLRLMSNTDGITNKIVTVIIINYETLHDQKHEDWLSIARPGMQLIHRVVSASSKSNNGRHISEILDVRKGITILKNMLDCPKCKGDDNMHKWVIQVLTQVIVSVSSKDQSVKPNDEYKESKERFTKWLVVRFLHGSGKKSFRKLAGESLAKLSLTSDTAPIKSILNAENRVADALASVLLEGNSKYRKSAAEILEHLCKHYNQADKDFMNLKEAMIREIPKVLKRLIPGADPDYETNFSYGYSWSYHVEEKEALASLCGTVQDKLIPTCPDLIRRQLDEEATEICKAICKEPALSFAGLLKEAKQEVEDLKTWSMDPEFSPSDDDDEDPDDSLSPDIQ